MIKPFRTFHYDSEINPVDLNLLPGEVITGMTHLCGNIYVLTTERTFKLVRKSRLRIWWEKIWK